MLLLLNYILNKHIVITKFELGIIKNTTSKKQKKVAYRIKSSPHSFFGGYHYYLPLGKIEKSYLPRPTDSGDNFFQFFPRVNNNDIPLKLVW